MPEADRGAVLDYLVENIYAFHPSGDGGPHLSGGTIGLAPTVRALTDGGRDDVLWDVLQQDAQPSYGFFLQPTNANPEGFTTIGEQWNRGASRNHMILAQIEEWFHEGLAGIREAEGSTQYRAARDQAAARRRPHVRRGQLPQPAGPHPVGVDDQGRPLRPDGRDPRRTPPPRSGCRSSYSNEETVPKRAKLLRTEDGYAVYQVGSGVYTFASAGPPVTG